MVYTHDMRVTQLEKAWTLNHAVGTSSPSWVKLTKSLQQSSNPIIAGCVESKPKLGGIIILWAH